MLCFGGDPSTVNSYYQLFQKKTTINQGDAACDVAVGKREQNTFLTSQKAAVADYTDFNQYM
jgi:hypothetical protein